MGVKNLEAYDRGVLLLLPNVLFPLLLDFVLSFLSSGARSSPMRLTNPLILLNRVRFLPPSPCSSAPSPCSGSSLDCRIREEAVDDERVIGVSVLPLGNDGNDVLGVAGATASGSGSGFAIVDTVASGSVGLPVGSATGSGESGGSSGDLEIGVASTSLCAASSPTALWLTDETETDISSSPSATVLGGLARRM